MNTQPLQPSEQLIIQYVCFLARTMPITSILGYLNAISVLHKWCSLSFDWSMLAFPRLHLILAGISHDGIPSKNSRKVAFGRKELLSLRSFCLNFGLSSLQFAAWTAVIVCFWGCLRSDNVVPKTSSTFDPLRQVCLANMQSIPEGIVVVLAKTKTRSHHGAELRVLLPILNDLKLLCPVRAINSLVVSVPPDPSGPLFCYKLGSLIKSLLYRDIRSTIRNWASSMHFSVSRFGSQSARSGGATTAFRGGVDSVGIMKFGDWLSNAFLSYIRQELVDLSAIHLKMLNELQSQPME